MASTCRFPSRETDPATMPWRPPCWVLGLQLFSEVRFISGLMACRDVLVPRAVLLHLCSVSALLQGFVSPVPVPAGCYRLVSRL
jgi:hypothetical protein